MSKKIDLQTLMALSYPFEIGPYQDEDFKGYYAKYKDLPVMVYSSEKDQTLLQDLEDAKEEYFATAIKEGLIIPPPTVNREDASAKTRFTMRVGKSLHQKLADFATDENLSLNTAAIMLLERGLADTERESLKNSLDMALKQLQQLEKQQQGLLSFNIINRDEPVQSKPIFEEKTGSFFTSKYN